MSLQISYHYTDGILDTTESNYNSKVICTATVPGQTMKVLTDIATLDLNTVKIDQGNFFNCQSPPSTQCLLASSVGNHVCVGQLNCAGSYQEIHSTQMSVPDGWHWTSWPTDVCVEIDQQQTLICLWQTDPLNIPPTI